MCKKFSCFLNPNIFGEPPNHAVAKSKESFLPFQFLGGNLSNSENSNHWRKLVNVNGYVKI